MPEVPQCQRSTEGFFWCGTGLQAILFIIIHNHRGPRGNTQRPTLLIVVTLTQVGFVGEFLLPLEPHRS